MKYLMCLLLFSYCKVNGQLIHKKTNKKKVHITTSSAGLSDIHITYNGTPLTPYQLNAGSQTLTPSYTPSNVGSYTVQASITDRNYLGEKYKPKNSILKYLSYAGIAVSILLAIFLFIRKRDEVITLPDEFNENY